MNDDAFHSFVRSKIVRTTPSFIQLSAGMKRIEEYKRRVISRCAVDQPGRAERFAASTPAKNKLPKVYGRVRLGFERWVKIHLEEYKHHAETLPPSARARLESRIKRIRDCSRAIKTRFQQNPATAASGASAQSSSPAKHDATHTGSVTTAPKTPFKCGLRGCLLHRRQLSEKRNDHLVAGVEDLPSRAKEAARLARRDLRPLIAKAKDSCERFQNTPLAARQERHLANLLELRRELRAVDDFKNYFVTIHLPYDPRNPADLTVDALRSRAVACKRIEEHLHASLFHEDLRSCMAWARTIECGHFGLVHLHVFYRGPKRDENVLVETARAAYESDVSVHVKRIKDDDVPRVLRYLTKPDGLKARHWHRFKRGERCEVPHPELDARFMLATHGLHTFSKRGLFRGGKS